VLFNSIEFLVFLPTVFILYWFVTKKSIIYQNILLVVASYIFYGWWDYRFLSLIIFSTVIDYIIGNRIGLASLERKRKILLWISILSNLGILFTFKYYNFFIESWIYAFEQVGWHINAHTINIVLPVGISFYTFQTMSYTIDIFRKKLEPTKDFIAFAAFVSFFPQLVAGPIERASNLLPQMLNKRRFDYQQGMSGLYLILLGFFKKLVIADAFAPIVADIFDNYNYYSSFSLILGVVLFAFQIYCDFSGYSDIARGLAKLLGFELMVNFNNPYFSRSIGEFWRRWHISLSTWFRDYLYIPLGGSKSGNKYIGIRNVFIIFLVSGFWHGANWTFITWGAIHALFFIPSFVIGTNRKFTDGIVPLGHKIPKGKYIVNILVTFIFVNIAWVFFRAENIEIAVNYLINISRNTGFNYFTSTNMGAAIFSSFIISICWLLYLLFIEYKFEMNIKPKITILTLTTQTIIILLFGHFIDNSMFIYFQF
jgi:alginate O-acetyltransferase complex protein AlgI